VQVAEDIEKIGPYPEDLPDGQWSSLRPRVQSLERRLHNEGRIVVRADLDGKEQALVAQQLAS